MSKYFRRFILRRNALNRTKAKNTPEKLKTPEKLHLMGIPFNGTYGFYYLIVFKEQSISISKYLHTLCTDKVYQRGKISFD